MNDNLEFFGEIFISEVRDRTIRIFDKRIEGLMNDKASQDLHKEIQSLNSSQQEIVNTIVYQVTDLCIHNILSMFEEHEELKLLFGNDNLIDMSDGLAGELYTDDGWIKKYSKQRTE